MELNVRKKGFLAQWPWALGFMMCVKKCVPLLPLQDSRNFFFRSPPIYWRLLRLIIFVHLAHGLRTPNEAFFHWNPKLLGLGRQIGQINFGAFGVFSAELSVPILVQWVPCPQIIPCPCFLLFSHYFYKKLSLYIHIPNIYLGLGFEFGPKRIRDLAFVCP